MEYKPILTDFIYTMYIAYNSGYTWNVPTFYLMSHEVMSGISHFWHYLGIKNVLEFVF